MHDMDKILKFYGKTGGIHIDLVFYSVKDRVNEPAVCITTAPVKLAKS
jgi:hypothetical protein